MLRINKIKKDIEKKKDELNKQKFEGNSELVSVVVTGDKKIDSVKFKGTFDSDDAEVLEDMIVIALNDAMKKVDEAADKVLGAYGSQLGGLF